MVPKQLGPAVYGQFVYLQDSFMKIIGFLDMGSSLAFFTKLSAKNDKKELITFYMSYAVLVLILLTLFIYLLNKFNYSQNIFPNISKEYIYLGLIFGFLTWLMQIFIKISDAYALTISTEIMKIIHRITSLLLLLYFIYEIGLNLNNYFIFQFISLAVFIVLSILILKNKYIFNDLSLFIIRSPKELIKEFISYCHPLFVQNTLILFIGLFDIWLLQKYGGSEQTGYYGISYSLAAMCLIFTSSMTPLIIREFSKFYEKKDMQRIKELFVLYIPMLYSLATFLSVFLAFQSENILFIFTNGSFYNAYWVLVIMSFYPMHQTYGQLSGGLFYAAGQTRLMRNITFFVQPLGLLVSFLLIYVYNLGASGLAIKMIFIQILGVNIQLYFNTKILSLKMMYFLLHQIFVLVFFCFLAYVSTFYIYSESKIINLFISGTIYLLLTIIGIYMNPSIIGLTRDKMKILLQRGK